MISFIVPAYNEEEQLPATLRALQTAGEALDDEWEVVVVDDNSTDPTARIATQHGARVVSVAHRQIAATRNSGAAAALGDLFIFVDADTRVTPEVIAAAVAALRDGVVGGGCMVEFDGVVPLYARMLIRMTMFLFRTTRIAAGCFIFCTRESFEASGGFDEELYASEEISLSLALKKQGKFVVLPERVVTSGRKVRAYSAREVFATLGRVAFRGRRAVRTREGLDIWYGERRADTV